MLASKTLLRTAVGLDVAAAIGVLPFHPASAAGAVADLRAEPSQR
ncbi:hypothetical protein [Candidatus Poriferisodalis sp.]